VIPASGGRCQRPDLAHVVDADADMGEPAQRHQPPQLVPADDLVEASQRFIRCRPCRSSEAPTGNRAVRRAKFPFGGILDEIRIPYFAGVRSDDGPEMPWRCMLLQGRPPDR
jgi:hypothetical protein